MYSNRFFMYDNTIAKIVIKIRQGIWEGQNICIKFWMWRSFIFIHQCNRMSGPVWTVNSSSLPEPLRMRPLDTSILLLTDLPINCWKISIWFDICLYRCSATNRQGHYLKLCWFNLPTSVIYIIWYIHLFLYLPQYINTYIYIYSKVAGSRGNDTTILYHTPFFSSYLATYV